MRANKYETKKLTNYCWPLPLDLGYFTVTSGTFSVSENKKKELRYKVKKVTLTF
jgi:hypothetical protein